MRKTIVISIVCLIAYAVFGFFAAPRLLTAKLPEIVQESVNATLSLASIQVNPFTLSVTVNQLELRSDQNESLAAVDRIHLNLQASSLFRRALYLKQVEIAGPRISAERNKAGELNLTALIPEPTQPDPENTGRPLRVKVDEILVSAGRLGFAEQREFEPFKTRLDQMQITLRDLDTLPDHKGQFNLDLSLEEGGSLGLTGQLTVEPLALTLAVDLQRLPLPMVGRYLDSTLPAEIAEGHVSSQFQLQFEATPSSIALTDGATSIDGLLLRTKADQEEFFRLGSLGLTGMAVNYPEQSAAIESITLTGGQASAWINADGTPSWQALLADSQQAPPPESADADDESAWQVNVARIEVDQYDLRFNDRSLRDAAELALENIQLTLESVSTDPNQSSQIQFRASPGANASISLTGSLLPLLPAMDTKISVENLQLAQVQPYLSERTGLVLNGGALSLRGDLSLGSKDGGSGASPGMRFAGGVKIDNFDVADATTGDTLSSWSALVIDQITLDTEPVAVEVNTIQLQEPFARVIIAEDRTTNIQAALMAPGQDPEQEDATTASSTSESAETPTENPPPQVSIAAIEISAGSLFFSDRSLTPRFETGIEALEGSISQLSSESLSRADVELAGSVDRYAPVSIKGQINPLSETAFTDITMDFDGIELTTFSPYSGRFAGHRIRKGKLDLDLRYKLNANVLEGENKIFLNQFALGERVDSPDATGLPVGLAIALLKDRNGNIDLDIPVRGNLDDPEFSLGGVIVKAFVGLITKVVTSPFGIFGKLIPGGGEDLQYVEFAPGAAELDELQINKLTNLAEGLFQRPGLTLEVSGKAHPDVDAIALAQLAFAEAQGLGRDAVGSDAYRAAIQSAAAQSAPAPEAEPQDEVTEGEEPASDPAADEAAVLANFQPTDDDLRSLASQRAQQIQSAILSAQDIEPERVFLLDPAVVPGGGEPVVRVEMSLGAGA